MQLKHITLDNKEDNKEDNNEETDQNEEQTKFHWITKCLTVSFISE